MDLTDNYHELRKQYYVIARARNPEKAQFSSQQIINGLAQHLGPYIKTSDIVYKAPNFIIHVTSAYAQRNILSERTIHAARFQLDVLPWSKEHENAQLPWTPAISESERVIKIKPLTILPVPSSKKACSGSINLRDSYAAAVGPACNLTAPDLSYLLIADIKDYYSKHAMFCACRAKAAEIATMVEYHTSAIIASVEPLRQAFQVIQATGVYSIQDRLKTIIMSLPGIVTGASAISNAVYEDMTLVREGPQTIMSFDSYQKLPALTQVPVPEKYVKRLRIIHADATKEAYGLDSFFTTTETPDGRYEIYRTMGVVTKRFIEEPLKTPAAIETAATYHSLKAITNWMGYKIMDINYPSLASLMAALQRLSTQMVLLQCVAYNGKEHSDQLYAYLGELHEEYSPVQQTIGDDALIAAAMERFCASVENYYRAMISLSNDFYVAKANFFAQHLDVASPTTRPKRWLTLRSEDGAYLPPPQP